MDTTQEIYLDNSATTRVSKEAAEKALYMMTECYGNPSSLHSKGFAAEKEMTAAREIIAERLSAQPGEIYFTSGGTESDNIAILGAAHAKKRAGNKIVTTAIEHPAVLNTMAQLEKEGFEVVYVQPEADGNIPKEKFDAAIDVKTILVSVMAVNNETGVLLPLKDIAGMIKRKKAPALFHTDAVQGFCKIPLQPKKLGVDLISVSGHKVHAPKGVGALYVKSGVRILPHSFGGGQEKNLRPGTENLPYALGLAAAATRLNKTMKSRDAAVHALNLRLREGLKAFPEVVINSPENAVPEVLNFSEMCIKSETMLAFLAEEQIYVSSASACGRGQPSHTLAAMGRDPLAIDTAIRVSFCADNTPEDVDAFLNRFEDGMKHLQKIRK